MSVLGLVLVIAVAFLAAFGLGVLLAWWGPELP